MPKDKKSKYRILKKTKIVATVGPTTSSVKTLKEIFKGGVNVARLNFSHGDHETHLTMIKRIRRVSHEIGKPVAVMVDLSGPKMRTGDLEDGAVKLSKGKTLTLVTKKQLGTAERMFVNYKKLPREVEKGQIILLDDGRRVLKVLETSDNSIVCRIMVGGTIKGRRGVTVPGAHLSMSSLTAKDRRDVAFALEQDIDLFALSYVRSAKDIVELKRLITRLGGDSKVMAKIETAEAVDDIDAIVDEADAIMVARGDLAIEIPREDVPMIQKRIVNKCNAVGKPVVIATQMLESMITAPVPTRAEVSDVANSILDGADGVMLSQETAMGEYPVEAVRVMATVARKIESELPRKGGLDRQGFYSREIRRHHTVDAISTAAVQAAIDVKAVAIVALTESGLTGRMLSRFRPPMPIIVMSPNVSTIRYSQLYFGAYPHKISGFQYVSQVTDDVKKILLEMGVGKLGDRIVIAAGVPFGKVGGTNMVLVSKIGE